MKAISFLPAPGVIRRLLRYFDPHRSLLIIAILGLAMFSLVDAGMIYFIQPLIDDGLAKANGMVLKMGALLILGIFLLRGLASFVANYTMAYVSSKITCLIRQQAFDHLQTLPLTFFQQHNSGNLISKVTYDAEQLSRATSETFLTLIRESLIVLVLLGIMFYSSWQLSLIFLFVGPVIALVINRVSKRFKQVSTHLQDAMGEVTRHCEQSISNHREILAFATQTYEQQRFARVNQNNRQQTMKLATASAISNPVVQLIASFAIAGVLWLSSLEGVIDQISVGTFTTTLVAMGSLLRPLKQLTNINQSLQRGLAAANSLFTLLDEPAERDKGTQTPLAFSHQLTITDLSFHYPGQEQAVLKNINIQLNKGQTLALVGKSGTCKRMC